MKKLTKIAVAVMLQALVMQGMTFAAEPPKKSPKAELSAEIDYREYNISDKQWLELEKTYKSVTKDRNVILALELLQNTVGSYSREAILGSNLTNRPIRVQFKDLSEINPSFKEFDAAGSKVSQKLYININNKHKDAPPIALAALLAHEALHQDAYNSINEETYAWTMEAAVWTKLSEANPDKVDKMHPLVQREERLKMLFVKGNYSDKYIRKSIIANPAYRNLPSRSPGFEDIEAL